MLIKRDLRLLITKACNYKCTFCHEEGLPKLAKSNLTAEDYAYFYKIASTYLKFETVTLTGGEPLLRNDVRDICKLLYNSGCKITLTTNGNLLGRNHDIGKYLEKVNISLHTLDEKKYEGIVQKEGAFEEFRESVKIFRENNPNTKIIFNITVVKDMNDSISDLLKIINYSKELNADIKFIELFPNTDTNCVSLEQLVILLKELNFKTIKSNYRIIVLSDGETNITLTRIFCEIQKNNVNENLCEKYNDLFISPDGNIKPCRNNDYSICIAEDIKNRNDMLLVDKLRGSIDSLGKECSVKKDTLLVV